ncbi:MULTISPECIES: glycosyltransferase family 4 protein [unclassified Micromonospora]|uniref:glycosyltransferase family 4 protein n=1 Tax=unclassified Micromonospora TaxID=2617518 RepID=UPI001E2B6C56|nr:MULTISPECIES: glycosyltransferase family 4 protein [unclassified Micromonospora]MCZ7474329.1 glycosyltransferase family 4 protein [Micromonospora sp. WMMC273]WBC04980.1 glycosyltransferase family 4 protein [Micromonospora sp. WMMA1976]
MIVKTNYGGLWTIPQACALRDRGHVVVVICPPGGRLNARLAEAGIRTVASPFSFRFRPTPATVVQLWQLRRLVRRLRVQVLYHHLYAATLAARLATVGLPLARVQFVAGPAFLESRAVRVVERVLWRLDRVIICGTRYTSHRYGELGVPASRRPAVTSGLNLAWATADLPDDTAATRAEARAKARADLGLTPDQFVVIMVAYVYPPRKLAAHRNRAFKGHDVLLAAWQKFRSGHPDAVLMLVGGGSDEAGEEHRQDLIRRFGLADDPSVRWIDTADDVRSYYRAADLSVSPSLSEGHGAPPEAALLDVPSIVSDAGGLPETVDETCGWVVPRDDVMMLARALAHAHTEFRSGGLAERGVRARERSWQHFDNRISAVRMAEIVEYAAGIGGSPQEYAPPATGKVLAR